MKYVFSFAAALLSAQLHAADYVRASFTCMVSATREDLDSPPTPYR